MEHALLQRPRHPVAAAQEDREHGVVLAEHVGLELLDVVGAGDLRQMLEQHRADAAPLMRVGDRERNLGAPRLAGHGVEEGVAADADDLLVGAVAQRRHQRHAIAEVELGELAQLVVGQARLHPEEAEIDRARAQPAEVIEQAGLVVGPNGAHVDRAAVAQDPVDGKRCGVSAHRSLNPQMGPDGH